MTDNQSYEAQIKKLQLLVEAAKVVNTSLDLEELLGIIMTSAINAIGADRGNLYLIDDEKKELWSKVDMKIETDEPPIVSTRKIISDKDTSFKSKTVEIRIPIGKGLAGHVALTGETVNINDALLDPRFDPEIDKRTGYRVKSILCMPVRNKYGEIIGVFQLLNKNTGEFTKDDEEFINAFSIHAGIAIENARIVQAMVNEERLAALGRMSSTIIHDIKNPMGTLRVYAQVLRKKASDEESVKLAEEMIRQVDRFVNMTQEILDYSRGTSTTNFQETDLFDLLEGTLAFLEKDLSKRNIHLVKNIAFKGAIKLDADKIMRVFYNISGNAADAMPNGGELFLNVFKRDNDLLIEFIDTGMGMPPEIKANIFAPFVKYGKKHGTGLGMAMVKKIVEDHKGRIEVDSEMGKGTTVRILLPLS
jgi:signal transduction histidine kinase